MKQLNKFMFIIIYFNILLLIGFFYSCGQTESQEIEKEDSLSRCSDDVDNDNDGKKDCEDSECKGFFFCLQCTDEDNDQYGDNCTKGEDCDDTSEKCTLVCNDIDDDSIYDCKDDCLDMDGDQYGQGTACIGYDCDETLTQCNSECIDADLDNIFDCVDNCVDIDRDGYGEGLSCEPDCEEGNRLCNVDCTTDENNNGARDCDEDCIDNDGDGYGEGQNCLGQDCDDNSITCNEDCLTDTNNNNNRDCDEDCVDLDRDGYGTGLDCVRDCDDNDLNNWSLCSNCMDQDSDGYYSMCDSYKTINGPDVDAVNPNCDSDPTDADNDGYCINHDCDDTLSHCTTNCEDSDSDGIIDCNYCINEPHRIGFYQTAEDIVDVALMGNYAFLASSSGMRIIDVSDGHNPFEISSLTDIGSVNSVFIKDTNAFISTSQGIQIIDASNILVPFVLSNFDTEKSYQDVYVLDNYAYAIDVFLFHVIDIGDIYQPIEVGLYDDTESEYSLNAFTINGSYAFIIYIYSIDIYTYISKLVILDISDPQNPQFVSSVYSNYEQLRVSVKNQYAYVSGWNHFGIIDISDINNPQQAKLMYLSGLLREFFIYNNNAFLAADYEDLHVFDLTNTPDIVEIAYYTLEDEYQETHGVYVSGVHAFLAIGGDYVNTGRGLQIISLLCDE